MNATPARPSDRPPSALRRALRLCTIDGLLAMPLVTMSLPVNVVLAALFTRTLHLPKESIGLIAALPFACNFLQIFVSPFLARWYRAKTITVVFASIHAVSWIALAGLLSVIPREDPVAAGHWLAVWFFVSSFAASLAGVSWNSWIQDWVPARLRGKYFAQRNRLLSLSTLTFLLLTGWALERFAYTMPVFQAVILVSVVLRVLAIKHIWQTPNVRPDGPLNFGVGGLAEQLGAVRGARSLIAFVVFGAIWSFAANSFGPFYHVFMFEQLDLTAVDVGVLSVLAAVGGALSLPAWGRLLDRYGNKSVMTVSLLLWQGQNFLWCFLTPDNRHWLYGMWVWGGMTSAGFVIGQFTLLLKLVPPQAKQLAIGINVALTSLVACLAPVFGGQVLGWALTRWPDTPLSVYHACFVVQPVLAIGGSLFLLRVREPQASPLTHVVGAMRNIRTLSGIFGLSFLVNYVFYRPNPKRP